VVGAQPVGAATSFVVRIDQTSQISQTFGTPLIICVAGSPTDNTLFCWVTQDQTTYAGSLWLTPGGPLSAASVWVEQTGNIPVESFGGLRISSAAIDGAGNVTRCSL
jgi:hypothetical protein